MHSRGRRRRLWQLPAAHQAATRRRRALELRETCDAKVTQAREEIHTHSIHTLNASCLRGHFLKVVEESVQGSCIYCEEISRSHTVDAPTKKLNASKHHHSTPTQTDGTPHHREKTTPNSHTSQPRISKSKHGASAHTRPQQTHPPMASTQPHTASHIEHTWS